MKDDYDENEHYLEDTGDVDENGNRIFVEREVENRPDGAYGIGLWLGKKASEHPLIALIVAIIAGIIIFICLNK